MSLPHLANEACHSTCVLSDCTTFPSHVSSPPFFQSDVSQRGKRFDSKTKSKKNFDQTAVHVRPETKGDGGDAPVQSEAPSEGEGGGVERMQTNPMVAKNDRLSRIHAHASFLL